ncbi:MULTISPECIES: 3-keto-5-aminohexanoate cleavage protein [Streptomyces]|uniref:3-keto-5-aminohexanoate cleavage protein n=1 Tax=Streptomyces sudanensis TaxID=436397 RepID=A0ABY4T8T3_9ACTN|nr:MULTISPECIES: 3-keto-5-aminohexanoate cleavage protein [Streptomyces]URN14675.1 3-keto-5-aminohexanoate cleavage protein [Streptomyces sudanensis]
MIQACLNGGRTANEHPGVPVTPEALAEQARAAQAAGAASIHMHPRDAHGRETLHPADIDAALKAVRRVCTVPVGVSTGIWMTGGDPRRRLDELARWRDLAEPPDFASVNIGEPGFGETVRLLLDLDIGVEVGIWSEEDARTFVTGHRADHYTRLLVEVIDRPVERSIADARRILDVLAAVEDDAVPVQLHADGDAAWPVLRLALRWGLETRIGLEDTLLDADRSPAEDNARLVAQAVRQRKCP